MVKLNRRSILGTIVLSLLYCVALPVDAKKPRPMDLGCAAETVAKRTGGKVLAAEEVEAKKERFFRIKVLTRKGRVRYVRISTKAKCVL